MQQGTVSSGLAECVCSLEEAAIPVPPLLYLLWGVCTVAQGTVVRYMVLNILSVH